MLDGLTTNIQFVFQCDVNTLVTRDLMTNYVSSRFSINSKAFASELLCLRHFMHNTMFSMFRLSTTQ